MINRGGPAGTVTALRAAMPDMIPVGAGALIGPDGGQVAGLADDSLAAGPGAAIDARLEDLEGRLAALEQTEAAEVAP